MKIFYILIWCICTTSAYAQTVSNNVEASEINGSYSFHNITVAISNNETKAEILAKTFNDTTSLKELNELLIPLQPVFLSAHIQNGILTACTLWNDLKEYNIVENGSLLLPAKELDTDIESEEEGMRSHSYRLSPKYSLVIEGDKATFTFRELYGSSQYNFTLQAATTITLIRDKFYNETL